ncbi:hypothetical protein CLOSYM_01592 [[Clostridium] symbiosum ATCC 14940]|uniref:Uncharacterized protein n=1 Tax=[Clostridium] symbiosum ATCC 14940 TaxID=411472 RepID=A0ABC9TZM4_CLOSY|nr:hypothetical protein CLOSYM_01592 [[Clostridium] symbiosum ATCC 14940]
MEYMDKNSQFVNICKRKFTFTGSQLYWQFFIFMIKYNVRVLIRNNLCKKKR